MNSELSNIILQAGAVSTKNWLHGIHLLESACSKYPREPKLHLALADIYVQKQKFDLAAKSLKKALTLQAGDDPTYLALAHCHYMLFEYDEALKLYDKVKVQHPDVIYNRALCLAYQGRHRESIEAIKESLKHSETNPFIYFLLIEQCMRVGMDEEAESYLRICQNRIGKHKSLMLLAALLYSKTGIWLKAYNAFAEYEKVAKFSNYDHVHAYAGSAWKIGREEKAIELFEQAISMAPYIPEFHQDLIRLLIEKKDFHAANLALDRAFTHLSRSNHNLILLRERVLRQLSKDKGK